MSRYIELEAVMKTARDGYHSDFGKSMADLTSLREVLEDTPTADVAEVRHGKWNTVLDESILEHYNNDVDIFACSICGIKSKRPTIFCPSCGARMDGGFEE